MKCEFCEKEFDFMKGGGDQIVLRLEKSWSDQGELAMVCNSCKKEYEGGKSAKEIQKHSQIFELSEKPEQDFQKAELWGRKYGEGERWVQEEKRRATDKAVAASRGVKLSSVK